MEEEEEALVVAAVVESEDHVAVKLDPLAVDLWTDIDEIPLMGPCLLDLAIILLLRTIIAAEVHLHHLEAEEEEADTTMTKKKWTILNAVCRSLSVSLLPAQATGMEMVPAIEVDNSMKKLTTLKIVSINWNSVAAAVEEKKRSIIVAARLRRRLVVDITVAIIAGVAVVDLLPIHPHLHLGQIRLPVREEADPDPLRHLLDHGLAVDRDRIQVEAVVAEVYLPPEKVEVDVDVVDRSQSYHLIYR